MNSSNQWKNRRWSMAKLRSEQKTHPWLTQAGLIKAVKTIRKLCLCGYRSDRCDCKFGIRADIEVSSITGREQETINRDSGGEQTGCPEMYVILELLSKLTKKEFDEIMRRPTTRHAVERASGMRKRVAA
jgi:hypothetical protein